MPYYIYMVKFNNNFSYCFWWVDFFYYLCTIFRRGAKLLVLPMQRHSSLQD